MADLLSNQKLEKIITQDPYRFFSRTGALCLNAFSSRLSSEQYKASRGRGGVTLAETNDSLDTALHSALRLDVDQMAQAQATMAQPSRL